MQDSIPTFPNRDVFAFTVRGASNENLLTIQLTPQGAQTPDPDLSLRIDQYSLASDFALSVSAPPSATPGNIGTLTEGQWSTLNVLFTPSGINDVAFDIKFQGVSAATGILTGAAGQSLGTYGMLWTPFDADDEGSNILILDDLSLVPEPSSALLLGLAGLGFMTRRRRA
jgi:hypothetical protein